MKRPDIVRVPILLSCALFLFSLAGCGTTGTGIYWDAGPERRGGPPPYRPSHEYPAVRKGGPPSHAPAHGYRAKHTYHYYPHEQVYYDVSERLYFYVEGDMWTASVSLPSNLHVHLGDYVTIEMDSDKPYTQFEEHKRKYPPGQMKKKKKKKGKW